MDSENDPQKNEKSIPDLILPASDRTADQLKTFTTPLTRRGWPRWLVYLMAAIGLVYVLNPTLGIFELLPDNLPLVGNLDEGIAFLMVWFGLIEVIESKQER